jgi:ribosome-binding protein aMBF1 (putative translation factor)
MIAMVEEYSAIDDMDEKVKKVERLIRQAGKRGISRQELGRKTHFMSDVLDKIEETLVDRGVITVSTLPSSKNGKTSKLYIIVRRK